MTDPLRRRLVAAHPTGDLRARLNRRTLAGLLAPYGRDTAPDPRTAPAPRRARPGTSP